MMYSSKILTALVMLPIVFSCNSSGGKGGNKKQQSLTYSFEYNGCKTGEHTFSSKEALCEGLADDELNNGCAQEMRFNRWTEEGCEEAPESADSSDKDSSDHGSPEHGPKTGDKDKTGKKPGGSVPPKETGDDKEDEDGDKESTSGVPTEGGGWTPWTPTDDEEDEDEESSSGEKKCHNACYANFPATADGCYTGPIAQYNCTGAEFRPSSNNYRCTCE